MIHSKDIGFSVKLLSLFFLVFSLWPFYIDYRIHANVGINPQRIIIAFIFFVLLTNILMNFSFRKRLFFIWRTDKLLHVTFLIYILFRFATGIVNGSLLSIFLAINEFLSNIVLFYAAVIFLNNERKIDYFLKWVFLSGVCVAILAIIEYFVQENLFVNLTSMDSRAAMGAAREVTRGGTLRVKATFENALTLTQYFILVIPISFYFYYIFRKKIYLLGVLLLIVANFLTFSRSGFLALLIVSICYFMMRVYRRNIYMEKGKRISTWIFIFLSIFSFLFFSLFFLNSINYERAEGLSGGLFESSARFIQFYNGVIAIQQRPIFGFGLGSGGEVVVNVGETFSSAMAAHLSVVDSLFLSIAIESGLIALVCFLFFFLKIILKILRGSLYVNIHKIQSLKFLAIGCSVLGAFFIMSILSIFTILPGVFLILGAGYAQSKTVELKN